MTTALVCVGGVLAAAVLMFSFAVHSRESWTRASPEMTPRVLSYCDNNNLSECERLAYAFAADLRRRGYDRVSFISYIPRGATAGHVVCLISLPDGREVYVEPANGRVIHPQEILASPGYTVTDALRYPERMIAGASVDGQTPGGLRESGPQHAGTSTAARDAGDPSGGGR